MIYRFILASIICASIVIGCDKPAPPPVFPPTSPELPEPATRPTTQEILQGASHRIPLQTIPFSVEVPTSWSIQPAANGSGINLIGPGPRFDYQIHLAERPALKEMQFGLMLTAATKESSQQTDPHHFSNVRKIGNITVLERMIPDPISSVPLMDAYGLTVKNRVTPIRWRVNLYVPHDKEVMVYELTFVDVAAEQYELDKELLNRIIGSLQHEPGL